MVPTSSVSSTSSPMSQLSFFQSEVSPTLSLHVQAREYQSPRRTKKSPRRRKSSRATSMPTTINNDEIVTSTNRPTTIDNANNNSNVHASSSQYRALAPTPVQHVHAPSTQHRVLAPPTHVQHAHAPTNHVQHAHAPSAINHPRMPFLPLYSPYLHTPPYMQHPQFSHWPPPTLPSPYYGFSGGGHPMNHPIPAR